MPRDRAPAQAEEAFYSDSYYRNYRTAAGGDPGGERRDTGGSPRLSPMAYEKSPLSLLFLYTILNLNTKLIRV